MSERTYCGKTLGELEELESKATDAPWHYVQVEVLRDVKAGRKDVVTSCGTSNNNDVNDLSFIAATRNAMREMIAHIRELESDNKRLVESWKCEKYALERQREETYLRLCSVSEKLQKMLKLQAENGEMIDKNRELVRQLVEAMGAQATLKDGGK